MGTARRVLGRGGWPFAFAALTGLAASVWTAPALGAPIRYDYSGTVTSAQPGWNAAAGDKFVGSFVYDPEPNVKGEGSTYVAPVQANGKPGVNPYASGMMLRVGGTTVYNAKDGVNLGLTQTEAFKTSGGETPAHTELAITNLAAGPGPIAIALNLKNPGRVVFNTPGTPKSLSLSDFPSAELVVTGNPTTPQSSVAFRGNIETLRAVPFGTPDPVPVPEPAALAAWLVAAGAGWGVRARARARNRTRSEG